jgi:hypothetical protein
VIDGGKTKTHGAAWWLLAVILAVAGLVLVVSLVNLLNADGTSGGAQSPGLTTSSQQAEASTLRQEIESGKAQILQIESQLQAMEDRLVEQERTMDSYLARGMIDQHNNLVPSYNSLLNEYDALYDRYSRLIDEVNAKVDLYNAGAR